MSKVDDHLIKKLEGLSRLQLSDLERSKLTNDLEAVLDMVEKLSEVDTDAVIPLTHLVDNELVLREDEVKNQLTVAEALENAPDKEEPYFRVPKVIQRP